MSSCKRLRYLRAVLDHQARLLQLAEKRNQTTRASAIRKRMHAVKELIGDVEARQEMKGRGW